MLYFKSDESITVYLNDGNIAVWESTHPDFNKVVKASIDANWIQIQALHNINKAILQNEVHVSDSVIIKNESEALRRDDPASRICDPRFEPTMKPMGNCGQHGFCGQLAPISCYTCRNFQPWLDGPHEAVLNHLVSERERLMMATDARIASINDRTILAVAEVVRRCEEIRSEMSEAENG